jgi:hypothetical protein
VPSGQKSFCGRARLEAIAKGGWKRAAAKAGKQLAAQAAMKTHLSQPIGAGAFDGQQGISSVIASAVADVTSVIAASDIGPAMTGRANGAMTRPAIMKTASSRRMVICRFTPQNPTDAIKLKASRINDAVIMRKAVQDRQSRKPLQPETLAHLATLDRTTDRLPFGWAGGALSGGYMPAGYVG